MFVSECELLVLARFKLGAALSVQVKHRICCKRDKFDHPEKPKRSRIDLFSPEYVAV
ncbi:hypothetical protein G9444_0631 [Rhodococcus erythropolis]|uniref:Uncharacterized protein n=1 Tax=Rhodococcus erythropolis TaxID=1833 RepID=A0A6G9CLH3_RHOER|nr:hypothetical protein G9444_0631 [Rhodococcus erythropolis]